MSIHTLAAYTLLLVNVALAAPLHIRQAASADLTVVKFAALAELLESTFYAQAIDKFGPAGNGGLDQVTLDQITVIRDDEQTHLTTLQSVATSLGGSTADVDSCTFDFEAALADIPSFLATARVLEVIGVDAYIGGTTLIEDKGLLVSAAEIATVEARHSAMLDLLNGGAGIPNPFDTVLSPEQVLSAAAPFISGGCDPVAALVPVLILSLSRPTVDPGLTLTNTDPLGVGTLLTFGGAGLEGQDTAELFCNMIVGGAAEAVSLSLAECRVPEGIDGPVLVFVTSSDTALAANIVTQDKEAIVAGPAVAFIDSQPHSLASSIASGEAGAGGWGPSLDLSPLVQDGPKKAVLVTEITVTE